MDNDVPCAFKEPAATQELEIYGRGIEVDVSVKDISAGIAKNK